MNKSVGDHEFAIDGKSLIYGLFIYEREQSTGSFRKDQPSTTESMSREHVPFSRILQVSTRLQKFVPNLLMFIHTGARSTRKTDLGSQQAQLISPQIKHERPNQDTSTHRHPQGNENYAACSTRADAQSTPQT